MSSASWAGIATTTASSMSATARSMPAPIRSGSTTTSSPKRRRARRRAHRVRADAGQRGGARTIIGVDRLDYSKGLEERFLGYRRFLEEHDERQGEVFLLQIAPPSRGEVATYEVIRERLDELSGRINGEFAEIDWVPIRYVNQGYSREDLAGFYRAAEIGLITPLRDGMNLVAKEYVAAQDPDDPGVLILSRFAGAALQLKDAMLVNPYSKEEISDAIRRRSKCRRRSGCGAGGR
jgi:trehalose 6-phosphate synthase